VLDLRHLDQFQFSYAVALFPQVAHVLDEACRQRGMPGIQVVVLPKRMADALDQTSRSGLLVPGLNALNALQQIRSENPDEASGPAMNQTGQPATTSDLLQRAVALRRYQHSGTGYERPNEEQPDWLRPHGDRVNICCVLWLRPHVIGGKCEIVALTVQCSARLCSVLTELVNALQKGDRCPGLFARDA
jgi:hypothetical protein